MYHEIVARSCLHRQRRTSKLALQMHGSQSWATGCHARHRVAHVCNRQPSELFNLLNVRPALTFQNSEANRHHFLLHFVNTRIRSGKFYIWQKQGSESSASINHRFTLLAQAMLRRVLLFQVIADRRNHMHNFYSRTAIYLHDDTSLFRMSQRTGAAGRRLLGTPRNCSHRSGNAPGRQNYMRGLSQ
jgi:hypothetical protein